MSRWRQRKTNARRKGRQERFFRDWRSCICAPRRLRCKHNCAQPSARARIDSGKICPGLGPALVFHRTGMIPAQSMVECQIWLNSPDIRSEWCLNIFSFVVIRCRVKRGTCICDLTDQEACLRISVRSGCQARLRGRKGNVPASLESQAWLPLIALYSPPNVIWCLPRTQVTRSLGMYSGGVLILPKGYPPEDGTPPRCSYQQLVVHSQ